MEQLRLRSAFRLIGCVEHYMHHEEELTSPVEVFSKVPASPAAITATVGSLLSMVFVALHQVYILTDQGWSYAGDMGEFEPPM
mmetsp:Transcript_19164/g.47883  ORF Transcript_19164/g.47883 Transcript_19164/m.47883 type:complete len:83 (-) Transcript_19164:332-580(-)